MRVFINEKRAEAVINIYISLLRLVSLAAYLINHNQTLITTQLESNMRLLPLFLCGISPLLAQQNSGKPIIFT